MSCKQQDLIRKLIIAFSLEYLLFFGAEVVLPGIVTKIFNINILLLAVLGMTGVLILVKKKCLENSNSNKKNIVRLFLVTLFLVGISVITLYKVSVILLLLYMGMIIIVVRLLWVQEHK